MTRLTESRLLKLAAIFLTIFAAILTLSPAVRERTWNVEYRWTHWIGLLVWGILFAFAHREASQRLPERDPYLLPVAALLTGWGMLSIWRLESDFGLRQMVWMIVAVGVLVLGLRLPLDLGIVRRYKYILLSSGLLLTALTLIFGRNPTGAGPRLWLGCCDVYLQPSEPLKLLLAGYLAAYLADRLPSRTRIIPFLFPTLFVTGLALLLLIVQRDLGTASIFILLYASVLFLATGHRRVLLISGGTLILAALLGFFAVAVIRVRIEAWLNPWADPGGRAYQIIQSLLAIANGGILGRGPGLGSPLLVPVAHSDFIFTAIAEETGLVGIVGMLALFGLLISRGLRVALHAGGRFRRLLAAGITAYFAIQSLLIMGGNLRLLPLTGVTLPFVSYGGSSLLTSFVALLVLMLISNQTDEEPAPLPNPRPYFVFSGLVSIGFFAVALGGGWWTLIRGGDLLTRTDNARRSISDRYVPRGDLLDRNNNPIDVTEGQTSQLKRVYLYPQLAPVTGYTHPIFGQAGLEASLDDYLRGLQGNPASLIWWDRLLYGTPPPGLDVRLSIDLTLQTQADMLLGEHTGALVLLNAQSGDILAMASHPGYDPNQLDEIGSQLASDPNAPLLNRAAQGNYPPGLSLTPFVIASLGDNRVLTSTQRAILFKLLGFDTTPQIRMPVAAASEENTRISPLQMALAVASLSNKDGIRPAPHIALAVDTPQQGWVVLHALGEPTETFSSEAVISTTTALISNEKTYWEYTGGAHDGQHGITWYLAGTMPDWSGSPLALVVLLEDSTPLLSNQIGQQFLHEALLR